MSLSSQLFQDLLLLVLVWQLIRGLRHWEIIIHTAPLKSRRKRKPCSSASSDPPPFPGLIKMCEQEQHRVKEVPKLPPLMVTERGRPAEVDTSRQFCPTKQCRYYGWLGRGNIVSKVLSLNPGDKSKSKKEQRTASSG